MTRPCKESEALINLSETDFSACMMLDSYCHL